RTISSAQCASPSQRSRTTKETHASSVPAVPGSSGASPLPKPSATRREKRPRMKAAVGLRGGTGADSAEVLMAAGKPRAGAAAGVVHLDARPVANAADPRQRDAEPPAERLDRRPVLGRGAEEQLVLVAARQGELDRPVARLRHDFRRD